MASIRLYPSQDTSINKLYPLANAAFSPILLIESTYDDELINKNITRSIVQFDLSAFANQWNSISSYVGSYTATLYMFDSHPIDPQTDYDFTLVLQPLTAAWTEGRGLDLNFKRGNLNSNSGAANWYYKNRTTKWDNGASGGMVVSRSLSTSIYFQYGNEDLLANITPMVDAWIRGSIVNAGILISLTSSLEDTSGSLSAVYTNNKRFHSGDSHTFKRPYIEVCWNDRIVDDRNSFDLYTKQYITSSFNTSNNFLDIPSGSASFPGTISLRVNDGSTAPISSLTASRISGGIYQSNMVYYGLRSSLTDVWTITSVVPNISFSGTINVNTNPLNSLEYSDSYIIISTNIKKKYYNNSKILMKFYFSYNKYIETLTEVKNDISLLQKAYPKDATLEIHDEGTDMVLFKEELLNYDENGFWKIVDTNTWPRNRSYYCVLKYSVGNSTIVDKAKDYKFMLI